MPLDPQPMPRPAQTHALHGLSELADRYDLLLCDVWGVIHNGMHAHAPAIDALQRFRQRGGLVVLITNAPNPSWRVRERLDALHVPHDAYDAIVSSGDITIEILTAHGDVPLHYIGPPGELFLMHELERVTGRALRSASLADAEIVVCTGPIDSFGDRPEDYDDRLRGLKAREVPFVCANPDLVVQYGAELLFCAGAIAERYAAMDGPVIYAGKPHRAIYDGAIARAADLSRSLIARDRTLAIGDAMHTDMAGARHAGLSSLFISSGIHALDLHGIDGTDALLVDAYEQMCDGAGYHPDAMLPRLVW